MTAFLTAMCDRELDDSAPDWVHLFPLGEMTGRDGRRFSLSDPQALIELFNEGAVDLPIDYEHQADASPKDKSGPVPAAGWIKELKARADGLWGRVEWTAQASQLIAEKAYRYLSPSFFHRKGDNAIVRLKGAGLVHNPNLHLHALAAQQMEDSTLLSRLLKALDLPETGDEDDVFEQLGNLTRKLEELHAATQSIETPDPARFVPIEVVKDLHSSLGQATAQQARDRADRKVSDALSKGHISPGMKDWALDLCARNEADFDSFLNSFPPAFAHLFEPSGMSGLPPGAGSEEIQTGLAATVCNQLGLAPGTLKA